MQSRGFTLLELMVVMALVALLFAIGWPGYAAIMERAHRSDAQLALLQIQHLQERHYARYLRYASRLGEVTDAETLAAPDRSDAGHYVIAVTAEAGDQTYTAIATAASSGRQFADLECRQLSVDQTGLRRSANAAGVWTSEGLRRCWG